jgi:DNA polymerase-3 subunit epsilon
MYAVIDTETSGLFRWDMPADADGQPRLAHLAMILVDRDLQEQDALDYLIRPDGWTMNPEATKIHGLTNEILMERGVPVAEALAAYAQVIDEARVIVAFNSQFDSKVMRGEMRRAGIDDRFERTPTICVMRALTDICQVPKASGKGFKFPKLSEAMGHFGIKQHGAHSADGDARAALELFRKLKEIGACPEPAIHFAKEQSAPQNGDRRPSRFPAA